jgi:spore coat protein SA
LAARHDVEVMTRPDTRLGGDGELQGVRWWCWSGPDPLEAVCARLSERSVDAIQTHQHAGWIPELASVAPVVAIVHNLPEQNGWGPAELAGLDRASRVISVSWFIARRIGPSAEAVHTGADLGAYQARWTATGCGWRVMARDAWGVDHHVPVVLFVGRLIPEKGVSLLFDAWPAVRSAVPDACLAIVGGRTSYAPEFADRVAERAARLEGVALVGPQPVGAMPCCFAAADVLVVPSQWEEPLGRVAYEAMAAGVPIVASRRGGIPEVVHDGVNGLLVDPPDDEAALASAIVRVLSDSPMAERLGRAGRRLAETTYDFSRFTDRLDAIYRELVG